jgi:RND family efflux transporter MFP subunit
MKNLQDLIKKSKTFLEKMSKKQKIFSIVIIIILIASISFFVKKSGTDQVEYKFSTISKGSVESIVSESGEIVSTGTVGIISTIDGIVNDVFVENGDTVKRGEKLFSVISTATEKERAIAYSTYKSALTTLDTAKNTHQSKQVSVEKVYDEISGHDDDEPFDIKEQRVTAETTRDNAYLSTLSAEASLSKAWFIYQATIDGIVKATSNGVIANLSVAKGQQVNAQENALLIISESEVWAKISVIENDVIGINPGQKSEITVDTFPSEKITGEVKRVDSIGIIVSNVVTFNVYILLDPIDINLMSSMTVSVNIATDKKEDVLVIPNSAIKPYQGSKAVQTLDKDSGQVLYLPIKVGVVGTLKSEVISGLKEGQEIIISSTSSTSPGTSSGGSLPIKIK